MTGSSAHVYSVEAAVGAQACAAIEADWNRLSESVAQRNAFASHGWFKAWADFRMQQEAAAHFEPYALVVREGARVAGLAPLVRRVASGGGMRVRKLEFVTGHADYNELVLGSDVPEQTDAVVTHLAQMASEWDVAELRDLREETRENITTALARHGLPFEIETEPDACPYLPVEGGAEEQSRRLSGHVRRVLKRRNTLAAEEGVTVRIIEEPHREPGLLETMIALEGMKHERSEFPPIMGRHVEVFRALLDELGSRGWLYVALLEKGEVAIAYQLGFRCGDRIWDYSKAHDHAYARLAPGTLLLQALLDYGAAKGFREYDFLRGEEPYKLQWSTGCHRRFRLLIWQPGLVPGLRKLIYHDLKATLRRRRPNAPSTV